MKQYLNDFQYPKVSVAVITYNQKLFLQECIESILLQEYPNIEIVIADDGSTDGTIELLEDYKHKYPEVFKTVLAEENKGITENSNKALKACTGKYIAWMGGDDLMLPGKLSKQVDLLEENEDCVICYHNLEVFDSETGNTLRYFNGGGKGNLPQEGGAEKLILYGTFLGACSVMTRRYACPVSGFESNIPIASDWLFWIETAINGRIVFINEILGKYRRHSKNVTNKKMDFKEQYLTLEIVEKKYPEYKYFVKRGNSRLKYAEGVNYILTGNYKLGRFKLLTAFREGYFSKKIFYWITISFLKK